MLALTHSVFFSPIVPSHTHFLFFSCSTASHSLPFINPPDDTVAHLASVFILHNSLWLGLLSPSLYRLPPPIPIKDLRAPLSANQVVIRAAKIRGLINKGLSLLASGSLCLNRWHRSAFWAHQIDARTPGVPWNGEERQSLALANNAGIGSLLPIFRGTLPGLVLHSTPLALFFFFLFLSSRQTFPTRQLAELHKHRDPKPLFSCITQEVKLLHWRKCIKKYQQTQQTLLSPIPNQHTLCCPIIPSPPTTANLLICPISPLQSNCSPSLEIAYHRPSLSPTTPYHQNSRPHPIHSAQLHRHVLALIHTYTVLRHTVLLLNSPQPPTSSHLVSTYTPPMKALHPAMAISRSTSPSVVLLLRFDFLSIKGAWISSLLFICSSVLSIYH